MSRHVLAGRAVADDVEGCAHQRCAGLVLLDVLRCVFLQKFYPLANRDNVLVNGSSLALPSIKFW